MRSNYVMQAHAQQNYITKNHNIDQSIFPANRSLLKRVYLKCLKTRITSLYVLILITSPSALYHSRPLFPGRILNPTSLYTGGVRC